MRRDNVATRGFVWLVLNCIKPNGTKFIHVQSVVLRRVRCVKGYFWILIEGPLVGAGIPAWAPSFVKLRSSGLPRATPHTASGPITGGQEV